MDTREHIRILMHKDHLEIISPGSLIPGISVREYLDGKVSAFRNPVTGNVFFRLRYIEKFGTGIARIKNEYNNSIQQPQFTIYENSISVILPKTTGELNDLDAAERLIMTVLSDQVCLEVNWRKTQSLARQP